METSNVTEDAAPGAAVKVGPITEHAARAHVIAPQHIQGVVTEIVDPAKETSIDLRHLAGGPPGTDVDLGKFGLAVHNALKNSVVGYILHVRQNGNLVHVGVWNWAETPADLNQGWTENTRMHVASVSKLMTAFGMVRLLKDKGISVDAKIIDYLPSYWAKGPKINQITFKHLMTHTSGFSAGGHTDFSTMKAKVAAGVPAVGAYAYENMNFGLCRILMSVINGNIAKGATFGGLSDQMWDLTTINAYKAYMQAKVFTPAGVANASFTPGANPALAYTFPDFGQHGWNSGDISTSSGAAGWHLSMKELLNVMNHARRKNTILPAATTQNLIDSYFGIDQVISTPAGLLYNKNGGWEVNGNTEQCVAYFWPKGMEMALFVNSPIGAPPGASPRNLVRDAFIASL